MSAALPASILHPAVSGEDALRTARTDAERVYRDLYILYRIELRLESDGWHVDYELKDETVQGGGPCYVIDAHTGAIVSKTYYQ